MTLSELLEDVNPQIFKPGFERELDIMGSKFSLVAKAGYVRMNEKESRQFRIEAKNNQGRTIGWVNFERIDDHLEALDLHVDPKFRRQGIATAMYKFAKDLGNTIKPSTKQTAMGKQFWTKDHS